VVGIAVLSLVLQRILPVYFPRLEILDLPLLATIYFGLSRRNPSTGLLLGTLMGNHARQPERTNSPARRIWDCQDRDWLPGILDWFAPGYEHPLARFALVAVFYVVHQAILTVVRRLLLNEPEGWFNMHLAIASLVNAVLGVVLFTFLDRLRR